jgi:hypothetical protein
MAALKAESRSTRGRAVRARMEALGGLAAPPRLRICAGPCREWKAVPANRAVEGWMCAPCRNLVRMHRVRQARVDYGVFQGRRRNGLGVNQS